jgi:hypothetical protein
MEMKEFFLNDIFNVFVYFDKYLIINIFFCRKIILVIHLKLSNQGKKTKKFSFLFLVLYRPLSLDIPLKLA